MKLVSLKVKGQFICDVYRIKMPLLVKVNIIMLSAFGIITNNVKEVNEGFEVYCFYNRFNPLFYLWVIFALIFHIIVDCTKSIIYNVHYVNDIMDNKRLYFLLRKKRTKKAGE